MSAPESENSSSQASLPILSGDRILQGAQKIRGIPPPYAEKEKKVLVTNIVGCRGVCAVRGSLGRVPGGPQGC